ncbi:MAG: glycosyltransferase family 2 protein [Fibrobacterota bacterium]
MNAPFFSVIIPVYNRKQLCKKAVHSVVSQTFSDYELIIVDDASTDGLSENFLFDGSLRSRCSYYRLAQNRGVSAARNFGICRARGTWLAFLDSDDLWHTKKLELQYNKCMEAPGFRIHQTREIWIRRGIRVNPPKKCEKYEGELFFDSLQRCMITPSSVVLHTSLIEQYGNFNESFPACEDYDLWLRITAREQVGLVDEYLLTRYGGHSDQLSRTMTVPDRYRVQALFTLLQQQLSPEKEYAARKVLEKKLSILLQGAKKRKRQDDISYYRKLYTIL